MRINIVTRELTDGYSFLPRFINKFLKYDLQHLLVNRSGEIGYGITYKVVNNVLVFSGTPTDDLLDRTLIIQVISRRGQIMKELWLRGVDERSGSKLWTNEAIL